MSQKQQKGDKHQKWLRLQIKGNSDFNFILPASPDWKVSTLEEHMIKIYNQVCSNELSNHTKAVQIKSLKRNGYYVASSLKVGAVFNDWDQVTCQIIVKKVNREEEQEDKKQLLEEMKKKLNKPFQGEQNNNKKNKKDQDKKQQKKTEHNKKSEDNKNNKKTQTKKEQIPPGPGLIPAYKLIKLMEQAKEEKQTDKQDTKKVQKQKAPQKPRKQSESQPKPTQNKKKTGSKTIIVQQPSDDSV